MSGLSRIGEEVRRGPREENAGDVVGGRPDVALRVAMTGAHDRLPSAMVTITWGW